MYSSTLANGKVHDAETGVDNDRVLAVYGIILGLLPAVLVLVFWSMGAILMLTGNGGIMVELQLTGAWRWLYFSYPIVILVALVLALGAFSMKRYLEAAGLAMLPVIGVVVYYLALVQLR